MLQKLNDLPTLVNVSKQSHEDFDYRVARTKEPGNKKNVSAQSVQSLSRPHEEALRPLL